MKPLFSWSNMVSKLKLKFDRAPTFHMPRRRIRPRLRTKAVKFRKPFSIKSLGFPQCRPKTKFRLKKRKFRRSRRTKPAKKPVPKVRIAELLTVLFSLRKAKEVEMDSSDQVTGDVTNTSVSVSERGNIGKEPFPSPITPAYLRINASSKKDNSSEDLENVEDACGSFENYIVEMIVEDGKLKDLMDVEELLYCWKNLKNPIFIELVCRFYGELCRDLFSPSVEGESQETDTMD